MNAISRIEVQQMDDTHHGNFWKHNGSKDPLVGDMVQEVAADIG